MNAIEFKNFSCFYKKKKELIPALNNINLEIKDGEFVAVIGESGAGKSTLLKSCLAIADVFDGDLLIGGTPIENIDYKTGNFGFVSQEIGLYPSMTVYENLAFPLRLMSTPRNEVDERVKEIAKYLDISFLLTRKPKQLSGGQQQRVAIGRAIIKNPNFMFFDEPFANVDKKLRLNLRLLVKDIHKKYQPTVLFVTHEIEEAFMLATRIIVLENGKIVEDGSVEELKTNYKSDLLKAFFSMKKIEF